MLSKSNDLVLNCSPALLSKNTTLSRITFSSFTPLKATRIWSGGAGRLEWVGLPNGLLVGCWHPAVGASPGGRALFTKLDRELGPPSPFPSFPFPLLPSSSPFHFPSYILPMSLFSPIASDFVSLSLSLFLFSFLISFKKK